MPSSELTTRQQVEKVSRPLLLRLHGLPKFAVPLVTLLLIGIGFLAPLPAAIPALIVVFAFVTWIAYLSWPAVDTKARVLRIVMLAFIVIMALGRFRFLVPGLV